MPRLIFLRHGARPKKRDALTPTGEAQARAVGPLLQAHALRPDLAIHTQTQRTRETVRIALGDGVARRAVSGAPKNAAELPGRLRTWCAAHGVPNTVLLCAHNGTQASLLKRLALQAPTSDRALVVLDIDGDDLRLVRAWSCPEDARSWRVLHPA